MDKQQCMTTMSQDTFSNINHIFHNFHRSLALNDFSEEKYIISNFDDQNLFLYESFKILADSWE